MILKQEDIKLQILKFEHDRKPEDRYASFDYCFNYFKTTESKNLIDNLEMSCLTIGFYLASWGMLRGSSFLLQKSVKYYKDLVEYIASLPKDTWLIDVDNYPDNYERILDIYTNVKLKVIKEKNTD